MTPPTRLRRAGAACALLGGLAVAAIHGPAWRHLTTEVIGHPRGDLAAYHLPLMDWTRTTLARGRLPLWNPLIFCGHPIWAEGQIAPISPAALLAWLPLTLGTNLWLIGLHAAVAVAATWWLLTLRLAPVVALMGGLSIAVSSAVVFRLPAGHPNIVACFPWLFLLAGVWNRWWRRAGASPLALASLAAALLIWAGHTQTAYGLLLWWGTSTLVCDGLAGLRAFARWLAGQLAVIGLGALTGSALLLPQMEFVRVSARQQFGLLDAAGYSFPAENLLTLLFPGCFGDGLTSPFTGEESPYLGRGGFFWEMALLLNPLVLGGLLLPHSRRHARARWGLWAATLLCSLLALGRQTPLFALAHAWLPGFGHFRGASKLMAPVLFGLTALGCLGIDRWWRSELPRAGPRRWTSVLGLAACLAALAAVLAAARSPESLPGRAIGWLATLPLRAEILERFPPNPSELPRPAPDSETSLLLTGTFVTAASRALLVWFALLALISAATQAPNRRRVWIAAAMVVGLGSVAWHAQPSLRTMDPQIAEFPPVLVSSLREMVGDGRLLFLGRWPRNVPMRYGLPTPNGYAALLGQRQSLFLKAALDHEPQVHENNALASTAGPQWRWLGLRALASTDAEANPPMPARPAAVWGNLRLWEVQGQRPLAFAASRAQTAHSLSSAVALLWDAGLGGEEIAVLETDEPAATARPDASPLALRRPAPSEIAVDLTPVHGGWVVVLESILPGWKAWVDGDSAAIRPAQVAFMAVRVPPGARQLRLAYQPATIRLGLFLTFTGAVGIALIGCHRPANGRST